MIIRFPTKINATPQAIWPHLTEPELLKGWMKGVTEIVRTSEGPRGVGTSSRLTFQDGARRAYYDIRLTRHDPPRRLSLDMTGEMLRNLVMQVDYVLEDNVDHTVVLYEASCDVRGIMAFILKLFGGMQAKAFLKRLKRNVESDSASA